MKLKKIAIIALLIVSASLVFAATVNEPEMIDTRSLGMGGKHITDTKDFYTMFKNPAGLALSGKKGMFSVLTLNVGGPLEQSPQIYDKLIVQGKEVQDILPELLGSGLNVNVGLDGPICFGGISKSGWAWSLFETVQADVTAPSISYAEINARVEAGFILAYGTKIIDWGNFLSLSLGASAEAFAITPQALITDSLTGIVGKVKSVAEDYESLAISSTVGVSTDLGAQLRLFNMIDVAFVMEDAFSPYWTTETTVAEAMADPAKLVNFEGSYELQSSNFRAGVGINLFPNGFLGGLISSFRVEADVKDAALAYRQFILKDVKLADKNPWLNVSAGAEVGVLSFIHARAGIEDAFMSVGAGLNIGPIHADAAIYTKALGLDPTSNKQMNATVTLGIHW